MIEITLVQPIRQYSQNRQPCSLSDILLHIIIYDRISFLTQICLFFMSFRLLHCGTGALLSLPHSIRHFTPFFFPPFQISSFCLVPPSIPGPHIRVDNKAADYIPSPFTASYEENRLNILTIFDYLLRIMYFSLHFYISHIFSFNLHINQFSLSLLRLSIPMPTYDRILIDMTQRNRDKKIQMSVQPHS